MDSTFLIRVLGTVGSPFTGTLHLELGPGESHTRVVSGSIPERFVFQATGISMNFRKGRAAGVLHLELLENGQRVTVAQTTSAFGSVTATRLR